MHGEGGYTGLQEGDGGEEMRTKDGGPAFPNRAEHDHEDMPGYDLKGGMSLRDYFAAAALTGMIASPNRLSSPDGRGVAAHTDEAYSRFAFIIADAMLVAREGAR